MKTFGEQIGLNAGTIWVSLSTQREPISLSALKTAIGLKDRDFHLALGWLARENKVHFIEQGNQVKVQLAQSEFYF
ncbi:MAG: winged helix-turn-helix domain-containing protein [Bacteroidales bacterium]|nr:winged helix-turn-helix domain-containing protein [Bacteroidales bacterium]